ncbi:NAD kinase-like [Tubulanus polymorphus]|uniref:NAD kinase-like n=1 Tax=Tubulanus polymorphus TaxID=672921 RepID=UPI003DA3026D
MSEKNTITKNLSSEKSQTGVGQWRNDEDIGGFRSKPLSVPVVIAPRDGDAIDQSKSAPDKICAHADAKSRLAYAPEIENNAKNPKTRERRRSMYGASPDYHFGPKASIMKQSLSLLTIQDPGSQRLIWSTPPENVLVIKKIMDPSIISPFKRIIAWFIEEKNISVFIEASVLDEPLIKEDRQFQNVIKHVHTYREGEDCLNEKIDLIISLGGDGTLLYASGLFQQRVPPIIAFHLGSLGFLTPFQFDSFEEYLIKVLEGNVPVMLRSRLKCVLHKHPGDNLENLQREYPATLQHKTKGSNFNVLVLNEIVIDRGPSSYISNLDLYIEKRLVTSVQGDGLIISTPTGSTAYACAAGASIIHPNVPAIMIVPICPHSLSFRPIVVPAGVEITVMLSPQARNTAWVSFDGKSRKELDHGDSVRISTSMYPVPSICSKNQIDDWFESLGECLHWNVRKHQRSLLPYNSSDVSLVNSDEASSTSDSNGQLP